MKHTCLKHLNTLFKKLQQQLDFLSRNPLQTWLQAVKPTFAHARNLSQYLLLKQVSKDETAAAVILSTFSFYIIMLPLGHEAEWLTASRTGSDSSCHS